MQNTEASFAVSLVARSSLWVVSSSVMMDGAWMMVDVGTSSASATGMESYPWLAVKKRQLSALFNRTSKCTLTGCGMHSVRHLIAWSTALCTAAGRMQTRSYSGMWHCKGCACAHAQLAKQWWRSDGQDSQEGFIITSFKQILVPQLSSAPRPWTFNVTHLCDEVGQGPQQHDEQEQPDAKQILPPTRHCMSRFRATSTIFSDRMTVHHDIRCVSARRESERERNWRYMRHLWGYDQKKLRTVNHCIEESICWSWWVSTVVVPTGSSGDCSNVSMSMWTMRMGRSWCGREGTDSEMRKRRAFLLDSELELPWRHTIRIKSPEKTYISEIGLYK